MTPVMPNTNRHIFYRLESKSDSKEHSDFDTYQEAIEFIGHQRRMGKSITEDSHQIVRYTEKLPDDDMVRLRFDQRVVMIERSGHTSVVAQIRVRD